MNLSHPALPACLTIPIRHCGLKGRNPSQGLAASRWIAALRATMTGEGGAARHNDGVGVGYGMVGIVTPIISPSRTMAASWSAVQPSVPAGRRGSTIQR